MEEACKCEKCRGLRASIAVDDKEIDDAIFDVIKAYHDKLKNELDICKKHSDDLEAWVGLYNEKEREVAQNGISL